MAAYDILIGTGKLYVADTGTTFPTLDEDPATTSGWRYVGPTADGIKVDFDETINEFSSDQDIGTVEAIRSEEKAMITANLFEATLENLADVMSQSVTSIAAGSGTTGYKQIGMSRGATVTKKAILFRANSPYGPYAGQYELPYGYISGKVGMEYKKDGMVVVACEFHALVDPNATDTTEKFGRIKYGNAAAL